MIVLNASVVLESSSKKKLKKTERGVVISKTDKSTYEIRTNSGKLTVKLSDGELREGSKVVIRQNGNSVSIEKLSGNKNDVTLNLNKSDTVAVNKSSSFLVSMLEKNNHIDVEQCESFKLNEKYDVKNGLYKFNSLENALSWVNKYSSESTEVQNNNTDKFSNNEVIFIRVSKSINGNQNAVLLTRNEAIDEFDFVMESNIKNDVLKSVSVSKILDSMPSETVLNTYKLIASDILLESANPLSIISDKNIFPKSPFFSEFPKLSDLQIDILNNIKELLLSNVKDDLSVKLKLQNITTEFIKTLFENSSHIVQNKNTVATIPLKENIPNSIIRFDSVKSAINWLENNSRIPNVLDRSTLEKYDNSELYIRVQESENGKESVFFNENGIKKEIGYILNYELSSKELKSVDSKNIFDLLVKNQTISLDQLFSLDNILSEKNGELNTNLQLSKSSLDLSLLQWLSVAVEHKKSLPDYFIESLFKVGSELPKSLGEIINNIENIKENYPFVTDNISVNSNGLNNKSEEEPYILNIIKNLGYNLENSLSEKIIGNDINLSDKKINVKLFLLSLLKNIRIANDSSSKIGISQSDENKQVTSQKSSGNMPSLTTDENISENRKINLPLNIRNLVENTLNKLESLQILSKPVNLNDGEQRVIVIPMQIDGEWTESRIKFVKKYKKNKNSSKNESLNYSVTMTVNPSFIGEVLIKIDYTKDKKLSVNFYFEKKGAKFWFKQNSENLVKSFKSMGIENVNVKTESIQKNDIGEKNNSLQDKSMYEFEFWG